MFGCKFFGNWSEARWRGKLRVWGSWLEEWVGGDGSACGDLGGGGGGLSVLVDCWRGCASLAGTEFLVVWLFAVECFFAI